MPLNEYVETREITHGKSTTSSIPNQHGQTRKGRSIDTVRQHPKLNNQQAKQEAQVQTLDPGSLKVPVPETQLRHEHLHTSTDHRPGFDETQSLNFDIDSSFDNSSSYVEFNDETVNLQRLHSHSSSSYQKPLPHGTTDPTFGRRNPAPGFLDSEPPLPGDWRAMADRERKLQGVRSRYEEVRQDTILQPMRVAEYNDSELPDELFEENPDDYQRSPSFTKSMPMTLTSPVTNKKFSLRQYHKPVESRERNLSAANEQPAEPGTLPDGEEIDNETQHRKPTRFKTHKAAELPVAIDRNDQEELPIDDAAKFSSKVSSYHESSSEEDQIPPEPPTKSKRPLSELDYGPEELKPMTFSNLNEIPFLTDPRDPISQPAIDINGNSVTLTQRLNNLSKMPRDDQTLMFKSLTDAENDEVPLYFLEQIQELMKKQMQLKVEKRKIALRYEMEVKKRQRLIEIRSRDVDDELKGLKKGGNELIEGRAKSTVVTPKKA